MGVEPAPVRGGEGLSPEVECMLPRALAETRWILAEIGRGEDGLPEPVEPARDSIRSEAAYRVVSNACDRIRRRRRPTARSWGGLH